VKKSKRMVIITTDQKGVFMGEVISYDPDKKYVILKDAQMCVYWPTKNKGVLDLAADGPKKGSRITPIIPQIELNGVTSVMNMTGKAVKKWKKQPWE